MNIVDKINKENEVKYNGKCKDGCGQFNDFCECLDWIRTSDGLPEPYKSVKVRLEDGTRSIWQLVEVEEFGLTFTDGDLYYDINVVTFWKYI